LQIDCSELGGEKFQPAGSGASARWWPTPVRSRSSARPSLLAKAARVS
jgi:hypothetical protein